MIIRNIDNTILSTGTRPNHTFAVLAFAFLLLFLQPDAIFWWQAWVQTSVGFLSSIIITTSSQLRHQSFETRFCRQAHVQTLMFLVFVGRFLEIFRSLSTNKSSAWLFFGGRRGSKRVLAFCRVSSLQLRHNFVTNPSKHDFVDRHTSKPSLFSMFFGCFLEILTLFFEKKAPYGPGADQDGPRWLMMAQDGPRWCRRWPQEGSRWPEMAQDGRKMASSWPQDCPKWPQDGPRWPQHGSRWLKVAQDCPAQPGNEPDAR